MRVLLCDDHRTFGESLASLLARRGIDVVGPVDSLVELDEAVPAQRVDVVLTDLRFPDVPVADVLPALRAALPGVPVVVLTAELDRQLLRGAVDAGADGVVIKTDGVSEIERVLRQVGAGAVGEPPPGAGWPVCSRNARARLQRDVPGGGRLALTERELDVLRLLTRGGSTSDLAAGLGIGAATVRTHVQNLLVKFGVHSRLELVAAALRSGVLEVSE